MDINTGKGFIRKLHKLTSRLSEVKASDCEPFDGIFRVDGVPFEVPLKPNATIEDVKHTVNFIEKSHARS